MTVSQLLRNLDSREITEWVAYYRVKHPSEGWHMVATVCRWIGAVFGQKNIPKYEAFLPKRDVPAVVMSAEAIMSRMSPFVIMKRE